MFIVPSGIKLPINGLRLLVVLRRTDPIFIERLGDSTSKWIALHEARGGITKVNLRPGPQPFG